VGFFPIGALPELGPHVDLYGLAATYIKLRTGHDPFGTDPVEILKRQKTLTPILTGLNRGEQTLVLQAFTPRPCHRYTDRITCWVEHLHCAASEAARHRSGQAVCALARNAHSSRKHSALLISGTTPTSARQRSPGCLARRNNPGFKYLSRNLGLSPNSPFIAHMNARIEIRCLPGRSSSQPSWRKPGQLPLSKRWQQGFLPLRGIRADLLGGQARGSICTVLQ
jgi:hypothetical protein